MIRVTHCSPSPCVPIHVFTVGFVLVGSGSTCRPREYTTRDGQCCPMCQEGKVVGKDCTAGSGTRCIPCETGTYMNKPNGLNSCFSCSSCDSGSGLSIKQNCTSKSDTVCDVLHGYFCKSWTDSSGCSTAAKHSACKPGQRIKHPEGSSTSDVVCSNGSKRHRHTLRAPFLGLAAAIGLLLVKGV
uniref:Tumor necrosis factor receptor superfamily member 6-like n=1 Tax=Cyprinodon variegatus TaxID=28743 RepID=A0A3Q2DVM7_CYPVA